MDRSKYGLSAAGEWRQLEKLFPELIGVAVLDLGCGYGWHSRYCAEHGAASVLGVDASETMVAEARKRNQTDGVTYRVCSLEDYEYPGESFDFVLSNLVLHYVDDLEGVYRKVHRTLKPDGIFLFNIEHPIFTASPGQDWAYRDGKPVHWPVDDYFYPGKRDTTFLGCKVQKYHHTLTQILGGMLSCG
ncbi:MAG: class I SAM-dependent methyltransferase, partial [Clostridia bacterium]|nr:class I SAM-dependent methyltransferase [Clostridia bacterium]